MIGKDDLADILQKQMDSDLAPEQHCAAHGLCPDAVKKVSVFAGIATSEIGPTSGLDVLEALSRTFAAGVELGVMLHGKIVEHRADYSARSGMPGTLAGLLGLNDWTDTLSDALSAVDAAVDAAGGGFQLPGIDTDAVLALGTKATKAAFVVLLESGAPYTLETVAKVASTLFGGGVLVGLDVGELIAERG